MDWSYLGFQWILLILGHPLSKPIRYQENGIKIWLRYSPNAQFDPKVEFLKILLKIFEIYLVKMIETLFPFLKTFFGNTSSTSGIYLWLKTTLKAATHLKKSVPCLRKSKSGMTGIHVVKNKNDFEFFVQVFNKIKIMSTVTNHFFLFYNFSKLIFQCSSIKIIQYRSKQG